MFARINPRPQAMLESRAYRESSPVPAASGRNTISARAASSIAAKRACSTLARWSEGGAE
jgi:hypothetical protein